MFKCLRTMVVLTALLAVATGCSSTSERDKYVLVVFSEDGSPIENAEVTPQVIGKNFESKFTGVDGQVNLRALYPQVPTRIMIRAPRHKSTSVKWTLPSPTAITVTVEKF